MAGFNALVDPAQVGSNVSNAFLQGMDYARQAKTRQAFVNYLRDPSEQTIGEVAANDPSLGMQLVDRETQRKALLLKTAKELQAQDLREKAVAGDPQAAAQLAGVDFDAWAKLDARQQVQLKQANDYIGQAALSISRLPEGQRPQAWNSYIAQGEQMGIPGLKQYEGQYSPDNLNAVLAKTGQMKTFFDLTQPHYMAVPQGADLVDVSNPAAVSQFGAEQMAGLPKVADQQSYDAVPAGGKYTDPDGNVRTKPGGAGGNAGGSFPNLERYYGHN